MDQTSIDQSKKKKKRAIIIIIILLAIIAAIIIWRMNTSPPGLSSGLKEGDLPGAEAAEHAEEDQITMQINAAPVFEDGESEGNLDIGNPDINEYDLIVEITLNDSGEKLYESERIPPGYYIDNDKLQKVLSKGTYEATAKLTYYDGDDVRVFYNVILNIEIQN
ncbi:MAG: hypothetical protein ACRC3H_24825 [Lachnospiraceae bacterium]